MKTIITCTNLCEAYIIQSKLRAFSVPAVIPLEHQVYTMPYYAIAFGYIAVQVKDSDFEIASNIIDDVPFSYTLPDTCPNCQSQNVKYRSANQFIGLIGILFMGAVFLPIFLTSKSYCSDCGLKWRSTFKLKPRYFLINLVIIFLAIIGLK